MKNALSVVILALGLLGLPARAEKTCTAYTVPVALAPGQPEIHWIAGELCHDGTLDAQRTLLVLVPGNAYGSVYWDYPYQPERYSFVDVIVDAGYATFAVDRLGTGFSSMPAASHLNMASNAYSIGEIVTKLANGSLTGFAHTTIILGGHSYGSAVAMLVASQRPEVDGLVVTGMLHSTSSGLLENSLAAEPAQLTPRLSDRPLGYLTTRAGQRGTFYYRPGADAHVIDVVDEGAKETYTVGEVLSLSQGLNASRNVNVPVISIVGDYDDLFCLFRCDGLLSIFDTEREGVHWNANARLELRVIGGTGHSLNTSYSAQTTFGVVREWLDRRFGTN